MTISKRPNLSFIDKNKHKNRQLNSVEYMGLDQ